jgi:ABC-type branched-subunit amino acid transport system substrate-binding protein
MDRYYKHLWGLFILVLGWMHTALAEPLVIKIGATLPLTGRLADAGEDVRRGLLLSVEEHSNLSLRLELFVEDNEHLGPRAASSAHKLIARDKVDILVSLWDMAEIVAPIAERADVVHLAIRADATLSTRFNRTITIESTIEEYARNLALLAGALGKKRVALVTEYSQGWSLINEAFRKFAGELGLEISGEERVSADEQDLRAALLRLLTRRPDLVILLSNPPLTQTTVRRLRTLAPRLDFTGHFEVIEPDLIHSLPFVAFFEPAPWFEKRFLSRFGAPFRARAPHAYDLITLVANALAASQSKPTSEQLIRRIMKLPIRAGATGKISFHAPRSIQNHCVWRIAENGKFSNYGAGLKK